MINRILTEGEYLIGGLAETLNSEYNIEISKACAENIINVMTNEFPSGSGKNRYEKCIFIERMENDELDHARSASAERMLTYAKNILGAKNDYKVSDILAKC